METFSEYVPETLRKHFISVAYRSRQTAIRLPFLALHLTLGKLMAKGRPAPSPAVIKEIQTRYRRLIDQDLEHALNGLYPVTLLGTPSVREHLRALPEALRQMPKTIFRVKNQNFKDLPKDQELEDYPPYYRRNFHWQTDGYLSRRSAAVYDLQTDWLFVGAVNAMRRQILPILRRELERHDDKLLKLLDIACGTGQTLKQVASTFPFMDLSGCDLSPHYVEHAQTHLPNSVTLWKDNAEALKSADQSYDIVTSTFLFHELPRRIRRRVYAEMFRVLKPGGLLVIEDSIQKTDCELIAPVLENFSEDFHEPYYGEYVIDNLEDGITEAGFKVEKTETHFLAKIVSARKPESKTE